MILHPGLPLPDATTEAAQDVGPTLEIFMRRQLYFGIPSQAGRLDSQAVGIQSKVTEVIYKRTSECFLDNFKSTALGFLPFMTGEELDKLLDDLYDGVEIPTPRRALLLVMLASGALCIAETEIAEDLFALAKAETYQYEDAVTLELIQYLLVAADYQANIGRPTSLYLYIGDACRRAFAMGLNVTDVDPTNPNEQKSSQKSLTLWCLYLYDMYYVLIMVLYLPKYTNGISTVGIPPWVDAKE